jgi:hypothetical protein
MHDLDVEHLFDLFLVLTGTSPGPTHLHDGWSRAPAFMSAAKMIWTKASTTSHTEDEEIKDNPQGWPRIREELARTKVSS